MRIQFVINQELMPKPRARGTVTKGGNIRFYQEKEYRDYQKEIEDQMIKILTKGFNWSYPVGLVVINEFIPKKRGKEPDLVDNQIGSVLDVLVSMLYLKDDNRKYIRASLIEGIESDRDRSVIWIYEMKNQDDRHTVMDQFARELQEVNNRLLLNKYKSKYTSY